MRKLAIIPARGGSKRVPRKNIRNFLGRPMLSYSIKTASKAQLFDEIMVSTDDEEIADIAQLYGANVPFMRSTENASDYASTVDALIEVLESYQKRGINFTYACCIYPTAPLITPYQIRRGYRKLIREQYDTLFPVSEFSYPIHRALSLDQTGSLQMMNQENLNSRSQDLPKAYHDAGQFYWFDVKKLLHAKTLFTENTGAIILPEHQVQDIDTEEDWKMAELKFQLINHYNENENQFLRRRA